MPPGPSRPLIIAHRGACRREPENSLAAFRSAMELGADGIELDVHATRDGALIVAHDGQLDHQPIARLELEVVRSHRLSNGELIPTLAEALDAIGPDGLVFVEVKTLPPAHDDALLQTLAAGPAPQHYHVHGFDHRIVRRLTQRQPELRGGVLSCSYPVRAFDAVVDAGARELWQEAPLIDQALVVGAHKRGLYVYAWTVDLPEQLRTLARLGVDGLCTNEPDVAREVLA